MVPSPSCYVPNNVIVESDTMKIGTFSPYPLASYFIFYKRVGLIEYKYVLAGNGWHKFETLVLINFISP